MEQLILKGVEEFEDANNSQSFENYYFPTTRFQGSKAKIIDWIWFNTKDFKFRTVLDAFGGTGCVSFMFKQQGKQVYYNDILKFNYIIGKALVENTHEQLEEDDIEYILAKHDIKYPSFIQDNFKDVFFLEEENQWLDMVITNIRNIDNEYKQAIAWFGLFQSCIIKRPYNLFHRANLYVRTDEVKRSFGNKTTWDKSFKDHFVNFVDEANRAVFDNKQKCKSLNYDVLELPIEDYDFDLVYIDSPYITSKGVGTDYLDYYHFLEGMLDYDNWENKILPKYKHKPLKGKGESPWTKKNEILDAFDKLFKRYRDSILVVSYRSDGIPSCDEILNLLKKYKKNIRELKKTDYKYALSHKKTEEILFIAE
ncbi:DNA adenine methylase [Tissierella pigra]|nr:DNA adenine methylase [Tissierella pigra]